MPTAISLTSFLDFVSKAGTPKLTVVKETKRQQQKPYGPHTDYWKELREGIVRMHKTSPAGTPDKKQLDRIIAQVDPAKKENYASYIRAYKKFLGRKIVNRKRPQKASWIHNGLEITLNPELFLELNGDLHVIKLYFRKSALPKTRAQIPLFLLHEALSSPTKKDVHFSVLDVLRSRLFSTETPNATLRALLLGEAESFATIWNSI